MIRISQARKRRPLLLAAGLAAGTFLALFHGALGGGRTFFLMDLRGFYRPAKSLLVPLAYASEGLPSWNPFFAQGQPFAANPHHALWHPMTALFFLLPFETAFRLQIVLPPLVAFAGMAFLLRSLRLGWLASMAGALSWAFGGYLLSTTRLLPLLLAVWALPYALGFAARLAAGGGPGSIAGLALSLGLTFLASEPAALAALPLLLAAALLQAPRAAPPAGLARRLGAAAGLGLLVGASALLPAAAFAAKTSRAAGVPESHAFGWSMPPSRLLELAAPFGATARPEQYPYFGAPFIASLYPGLLVAAAAVFALRRRGAWAWLAAAAPFTVLALGAHTPVWAWLRGLLPFFAAIRYPERFVMPLCLAVPVLGALGLQELMEHPRLARRVPPLAFATLVLLAAADLARAGRRLVPTVPLAQVTTPPGALRPLVGAGPGVRLFHLAEYRAPLLRQAEVAAPPIPAQWGIATALSRDYDLTELSWSAEATWAVSELLRTRPDLAGALLGRRGIDWVLRLDGDRLELVRDRASTGLAFLATRVEEAADARAWMETVRALGAESRTAAILAGPRPPALPRLPSAGSATLTRPRANVLEGRVEVAGPQPALLAVNETWDDGWEARVDGAPAPLLRTDLSLMGLALPPGAHQVRLRHRDPRLAWGLALSGLGLIGCAALAARGLRRPTRS